MMQGNLEEGELGSFFFHRPKQWSLAMLKTDKDSAMSVAEESFRQQGRRRPQGHTHKHAIMKIMTLRLRHDAPPTSTEAAPERNCWRMAWR